MRATPVNMHRALDLLPVEVWQLILEATTSQRDFNALARTASVLAALAREPAFCSRNKLRLAARVSWITRRNTFCFFCLLADSTRFGPYLIMKHDEDELRVSAELNFGTQGAEGPQLTYYTKDNGFFSYTFYQRGHEEVLDLSRRNIPSYVWRECNLWCDALTSRQVIACYLKRHDPVDALPCLAQELGINAIIKPPLRRIEHYACGKKEGESSVLNLKGGILIAAHYHDDQLHGERRIYYESGALSCLSYWEAGKRTGDWKYYYETGELRATCSYAEDRMKGNTTIYYSNGNISERYHLEPLADGIHALDGKYESWYLNGQRALVCFYAMGEYFHSYRKWDTAGYLELSCGFLNGELHGRFKYSRNRIMHYSTCGAGSPYSRPSSDYAKMILLCKGLKEYLPYTDDD